MNERYRGGEDIFLTLPDDYDIEHIDWISIYCYKFRVDFGHVTVSNISQRIPPYVPPPKKVRAFLHAFYTFEWLSYEVLSLSLVRGKALD